jgi:diguanylate cyclase (GGDEF)-like protein/PAS domain S-box-containing protein
VQTLLPASTPPRGNRPATIVWLFAAIVICLLGIAIYSSQLMSAGRALVGLEGAWAKAQKDAVYFLARYAAQGGEDDFRSFEKAMATLDAERGARLEQRRPVPDRPLARERLVAAGVHPTEAEGLLSLMDLMRNFGPMEYVLSQWSRGDRVADALAVMGGRLRAAGGRQDPEEVTRAILEIHQANFSIAAIEADIAQTLAEIQRTAQSLLAIGMLVITAVLLIGAIMLSRRFLAQNERLQQSLAGSESQLRLLVEAAPLPLIIARAADQQLVYANERALLQLGLGPDDAAQRTLADFHADPQVRSNLAQEISRHGAVSEFEVRLRNLQGRETWMLLSAQPVRYAGVVCLLVALADIDDRKRMQEDMVHRAMHDPLTGLPNRAMFLEALERAIHKSRRRSVRFSLLFVDLDHFKEVNDTMGHLAGDTLLKEIASRLESAVRQSDLVARLGGDEFVILLEENVGPEEVMIVAQKVLAMLARPVAIEHSEAGVSGSIGIATFPEDGADVEALLKSADSAMYQAKKRGRNAFQFYSAGTAAITAAVA